ncbi:MAG: alpha-glucuronidase family glycosyl hydrolase, partial [Armatimonadota bacterium]
MRSRPAAIIAATVVCCAALAGPITLVEDGRPTAVIVTGAEPSETVALAAEEIALYLQRMSGAGVPVQAAPLPDRPAVLVGAKAVEQFAAGLRLPELGPEGRLLRTLDEGYLLVAGQSEMGTLNGAYDLLHLLG